MSISHFPGKPHVPAATAALDHALVVAALARHGGNVTDAAQDLGVPASDLRRLLWSNPQLQDQAFETIEARLDTAEKNIHEALTSDDSRRRDAASFFVLRNTARAKRRGWIVSASGGVDVSINTNVPARTLTFRWRRDDDPDPLDDGKLIEHDKS
jgi:hypothetical protein